jgi:outer membrane immunogenic protein
MNYKTVLSAAGIALSSAAAFGVSAQAADLGGRHETYKEEPVYVAPASTWSGGYIGGHLGASWTSGTADVTTYYGDGYGSGHKDIGETSVLGGIHGGFNFQHGAFVYGFESDVSFANNIDYLASVRGRLGVAAGNWLFYGTGGVAFMGSNVSGAVVDAYGNGASYEVSSNQTGFVVGGGTEVKLSPNWSVGVEGLYYGFDGVTAVASGGNNTFDYNAKIETGADVGVVRGRLSYHFNRGYEPLK